MTTSTRTRAAALCALLATTALAAPALAQSAPETPPLYPAVDQNGVDVVSGRLSLTLASISIGPGGPGSLSHSWSIGPGAEARNSGYVTGGGSSYLVSIGASTEKFTLSGMLGSGTFTHAQGRPSTLTYDAAAQTFAYTAADGSVSLYQRYGDLSSTNSVYARILSVTSASGEKLNYAYRADGTFRSVWSNLGYQKRDINIGTASAPASKVVLFNMAQENCAPEADACSLTGTWPQLTIEQNKATDVLGRVTRIDYPSAGQVAIVYPSGRRVTYGYFYEGDVEKISSVTDGTGTWSYNYGGDQFVGINTITAPNGTTRTVFWQKMTGQVTQDTVMLQSQQSRTTSYSMDSAGRVLAVGNPDGTKVQVSYDARGNLTEKRIVAKTPGTPPDIVTSAKYPDVCTNPKSCNKPVYIIDARGGRTDFAYEDPNHGQATRITSPAGPNGVRPEVRNSYTALSASYKNGSGLVVQGSPVYKLTASSQCATGSSCPGTADEIKTTVSYSAANALLPASTTSGSGDGALAATTAFTYTNVGDVKTVDEPLAGTADTVRNYYDPGRQLTGTIGPDPDGSTNPLLRRALRFSYNGEGQPVKREAGTAISNGDTGMGTFQPLEQELTEYDAQGRKAKESFVSGGVTSSVSQYSYTPTGQLDCAAQRMDTAAFGVLPGACTQSGAGKDRIAQYSYNQFFEQTKVRTGIGTTEAQDEVTTSYDVMSRPLSVADGNGNLTNHEYDGFGRLFRTVYPPASAGAARQYEEYAYDAGSNVTAFRNRAGETTGMDYDALGRMTFRNAPGTEPDVSYGYDNLGRLLSASQPGHSLSFSYDALGRNLTQAGPLGTVTSTYNLAGRRTRLRHPDGFYVDYDRLVTGEVSKIRENGATFGLGVLATFAYDNLGRRTSLTRGNGTITRYAYSGGRLAELAQDLAGTTRDLTTGFTYNAAGEIIQSNRSNEAYDWTAQSRSQTEVPNGLNQLASLAGTVLNYDARGNMTFDGTKTYAYSSSNMLTSSSNGVSLRYDPLARLHELAGGSTTRFGYDGIDLILEQEGSGAIKRRYVHGPAMDEPLVQYESSSTNSRRFLHADERGSIVAHTDDGGSATVVNTYDEYGVPGSGNQGQFQYTGQTWLRELGLYNYKARMYWPIGGRFLQADPLGYGDGMNLYAYVRGNPVNKVDPSGLCENGTNLFHNRWVFDRTGVLQSHTVTPLGFFCFDTPKLPDPTRSPTEFRNMVQPAGAPGQRTSDPCNARLPDGSTVNKNVDYLKSLRARAMAMAAFSPSLAAASLYSRWLNLVRPGGAWDYKLQKGGTEAQGNLNYGATGSLILPMNLLLRGAGAVQDPGAPGVSGRWYELGDSQYGDQLTDIPHIRKGAAQCKGT